MPGGVNSPVRAFRGVGGHPVFFREGEGAWMTDVDGNRYVDHVGSWGPLILGHALPAHRRGRHRRRPSRGTSFGAPHRGRGGARRADLATVPTWRRCAWSPAAPRPPRRRVRLARGFTGRDAILKFEGCYHGAGDPLPRQGGQRRGDARPAGLAGRARGAGGAHPHRALQ